MCFTETVTITLPGLKNDTRSPEYQVRCVRTKSPVGPIEASKSEVILCKKPEQGIFGTGHHSILSLPDKDEWRIIYHRFKFPDAVTGEETPDSIGKYALTNWNLMKTILL